MSTNFEDSFMNGDPILVTHVAQYAEPIKNLENGSALYSDDSGTVDAYKVDFSSGNEISTYEIGQVINFKAGSTNTGACTLTVTGPSGDLLAIPLVKRGNTALVAGDVLTGQVVSAVYVEDTGVGRFEMATGTVGATGPTGPIGPAGPAGMNGMDGVDGAPGADGQDGEDGMDGLQGPPGPNGSIDILTDVGLPNALADGQILQYESANSQFENRSPDAAGLVEQTRAINVNGPLTNGGTLANDVTIGIQQATGAQDGYLSSADHATFSSKQDELMGISDVPGLDTALSGKQPSSEKGQANGYAGLDGTGKVPLGQLPSSGMGASELDDLTDVAISSPADGQILQYNSANSQFENVSPTAVDVPALWVATNDTSTNYNANNFWEPVKWDQDATSQGTGISHSKTTNNTRITFSVAGTYMLSTQLALESTLSRANLKVRFRVNGTTFIGSTGSEGYLRNEDLHNQTSVSTEAVIVASAGDYVEVCTTREAVTGTVTLRIGESEVRVVCLQPTSAHVDVDTLDLGSSGITPSQGTVIYGNGTSFQGLSPGSNGQILKMASGIPSWANESPAGVTGSGVTNRLAYWSSSSNLTSSGLFYISGSKLYAQEFQSSGGKFHTSSDLQLVRSGATKAQFGFSQTWLYSVRNAGGGQLMYWNPTSKEVTFLYSRGAHKKNIKKIDTSIDDLMKWRAVEFDWKEKFGGHRDIGLISEEVASVFPLAATYDKEWEYTDKDTGDYKMDSKGAPKRKSGGDVPAGVKYERAWIPMLAAVQDFYRKYQQLESEVQELKKKLGDKK